MSAQTYQCPTCGASHEIREGDVAVKCRYCGTLFRTFEEESRYIAPVYFDSSRAVENFLLWVKKQTGYEESLPLHIVLRDIRLHFYPFWVTTVKARTSFTGVGEDAEYVQPAGRNAFRSIRTVYKPESGVFERILEVSIPASNEIPIAGEMVAVSRNRLFFSHDYVMRQGGVLHGATTTRQDAKNAAEQMARNELTKLITREVVQVNSRSDEIEVGEIALVYIPVWNIVYEFKGKRYHALVDASSSRVINATYPPDVLEKTAYIGVSAVHVLAGVVVAGLLLGFGWLPAVTSLSGFAAAAAIYAWRGLSPTKARETISEEGSLASRLQKLGLGPS